MFESLHFGIKRRQCVLNGVKLTQLTLMLQMEYAKLGCCHQNYLLYGSRRSVRDLMSETSKGSKTRLYQIVLTTEGVFQIVELAIT